MFRNRFRWKFFLINAVFFVAMAAIATDFDDLLFEWHIYLGYLGEEGLSVPEERGVKAALLAMCAAASLFVAMIPLGSGRMDKRLQLYTQAVGGFSALAAGCFWLLSEAGERTPSYLLALVPLIFICVATMALSSYLRWVGDRDDQLEDSSFRWLDVLGGFGLVLLLGVIFYFMPRLPSLIF